VSLLANYGAALPGFQPTANICKIAAAPFRAAEKRNADDAE
jgi:hypothetical protein